MLRKSDVGSCDMPRDYEDAYFFLLKGCVYSGFIPATQLNVANSSPSILSRSAVNYLAKAQESAITKLLDGFGNR